MSEKREDERMDAYCFAHKHKSREEEIICSLSFQLRRERKDNQKLRKSLERIHKQTMGIQIRILKDMDTRRHWMKAKEN